MGVTAVTLGPRPALHLWIRDSAAEVEDYFVDWCGRLPAGDTIAASTFTLPQGDLVAVTASNTIALAIVRLSGGTPGEVYQVMNRITTKAGRELEQVIRLHVRR